VHLAPAGRMASTLRERRLKARRVHADRLQMLDFVLGQLGDTGRLVLPEGVPLSEISLDALDVQAILECSENGEMVDLSSKLIASAAEAQESGIAQELALALKLEGGQLCAAAFETLLLQMEHAVAATDEQQALFHGIRLGLMVSKAAMRSIQANIRVEAEQLPASMCDQPIFPQSLHYRFQMLASRRPSGFDSDAMFQSWQERQIAVFLRGMRSEFVASQFIDRDTIANFESTVEEMFQELLDFSRPGEGRIKTRRSEGFPEKDYTDCLEKINRFLCNSLYPNFVSTRFVGASEDGCKICFSYGFPLNTLLYGRLLETCFDDEEKGTLSHNGHDILRFLQSGARNFLGISQHAHVLSYVAVLCDQLAESSSLGLTSELTEHIVQIPPDEGPAPPDPGLLNGQEGDREVVLAAVGEHGAALEYATSELKADKAVVMTAVTQDGDALRYASAKLQADAEVRSVAAGQRVTRYRDRQHRQTVLQRLRSHFRDCLMNYHSFHGDFERVQQYLNVYLKTGIAYTIDRSLMQLGAPLASPMPDSEGASRSRGEEVVLRAGLAERAGMRGGELGTVAVVHADGAVDVQMAADGRVCRAVPAATLASTLDPMSFLFAFVTDMITSATVKSYNALSGYRPRPLQVADLAEIVGECMQQLEKQVECFSPLFKVLPHHEPPDLEYIKMLSMLIAQDHGQMLEPDAVDDEDFRECIRLMEMFDDFVHCYVIDEGLDEAQVAPLLHHAEVLTVEDKLRAPISGLLWDWIQAQETNFDRFMDRLLELETWEPICEGVMHSSSVTDMFSMFRQAMDFFLGLELGVPEFLVHLLGSVVAGNMKYANLMKTHKTESSESGIAELQQELVSARPPLCRPARVENREMLRDTSPKLAPPSVADVCTRMCNVYHARRQFKALASDVTNRFYDLMEYRSKEIPETQQRQISNYLKSVNKTYKDAIFELQEFLGFLCVFFFMHQSYLEHLYVPTAGTEEAGVVCALQELEELIEDVKLMIEPELMDDVIGALKHAMLKGYKRILLDGGAHRVFEPADCDVFINDLARLVAFFGQDPQKPMRVEYISPDVGVVDQFMKCGRCNTLEANLFSKDRAAATAGVPHAKSKFLHTAHLAAWYNSVWLDSTALFQQQQATPFYCKSCAEDGREAAGERRRDYAITAPIEKIMDVIAVLQEGSGSLVELAADPEVAGARAIEGGAFEPSVITRVLSHRLDAVAVGHCQAVVPCYETGGVKLTALNHGNDLVKETARTMGSGIMNIAKSAKAAAASVSDSVADTMRFSVSEEMSAKEAMAAYGVAEPEPETGESTKGGFKKLFGRRRG
jgi:hypothetical protein